jgi:hypothetical protein
MEPNFAEKILNAIDEGTKQGYQSLWAALISFLSNHLIIISIVLVAIFIIAVIMALFGRWGILGKILYSYLYFGILLIIGLIWGSNIFVSDFFHLLCAILLYPICYWTVGIILNKAGLKR